MKKTEELQKITQLYPDCELPVVIYDTEFQLLWKNPYAEKRKDSFFPDKDGALKLLDLAKVKEALSARKIIHIKTTPSLFIGGEVTLILHNEKYIAALFESTQLPDEVFKRYSVMLPEILAAESKETVERLSLATSSVETLVASDDPEVEKQFDSIKRSMYRILRSSQNAEWISRYFTGALEMKKENCDLCAVVKALCASVSDVVSRQIKITVNLPASPIVSEISIQLFEKAFLNLLLNSIKYSREGNEIEVTLALSGNMVTVTVKDKGAGIKKENLGSVCSAFFSCEPCDDGGVRPGLGLGLAVATLFCETHGGTLLINSEFGKGTSVLMSFRHTESSELYFKMSPSKYITNKFSPIYVELNEVCEIPS